MKLKLITLSLSLLLFSHNALATQSTIPTSCPSVAAIKNVGVNSATYTPGLFWYAFNLTPNTYDTNIEWQLVVGLASDKKYDSEADAIKAANMQISFLLLQSGPTQTNPSNGMWECDYEGRINDNEAVIAKTFTSPVSMSTSALISGLKR